MHPSYLPRARLKETGGPLNHPKTSYLPRARLKEARWFCSPISPEHLPQTRLMDRVTPAALSLMDDLFQGD